MPIIDLHNNRIIHELIELKKLQKEIIIKLYIMTFFLMNLFVKNPERRLPIAIKSIKELDIIHPFI
jgi:hypothetical protein